MPYRRISDDLKERAMYLLEQGWITEDVMEVFGVSESSLYRWRRNVARYGTVQRPLNPLQGRPRLLSAEQTDAVLSFVDQCASRYLDEIMNWLAMHEEVAISRPALHAILRDAGYTYKILRRKASERNPESHAQFRELQANHLTARMCICVDESSKDDRTIYRHYGWAASGERATIDANFIRGDRWSILPAMSVDGYIALRIVPGSVDGPEFFDFIVNDVLPKMNPFPGERSVLILDNCAIHKSQTLREVVEASGSVIIFIPPYSPEFNPIEESFSAVKAWIRRNYMKFMRSEHPQLDLYEACSTVTAEKARSWFAHAGYEL